MIQLKDINMYINNIIYMTKTLVWAPETPLWQNTVSPDLQSCLFTLWHKITAVVVITFGGYSKSRVASLHRRDLQIGNTDVFLYFFCDFIKRKKTILGSKIPTKLDKLWGFLPNEIFVMRGLQLGSLGDKAYAASSRQVAVSQVTNCFSMSTV